MTVSLPPELWLQTIDYTYLPHLLHLALANHDMYDLARKALERHRNLKARNRSIVLRKRRDVTLRDLLIEVLSGQLPPSYVIEIDALTYSRALGTKPLWPSLGEDDKWLIIQAYQDASSRDSFRRWLDGNDVRDWQLACMFLLTLLPDLRKLVVRPQIIQLWHVLHALTKVDPNSMPQDRSLPLSRLTLLSIWLQSTDRELPRIEDASHARTNPLPALRRLVIYSKRNHYSIDWVSHFLREVPEIFFVRSAVDSQHIKQWAKPLKVPCTIRQSWRAIESFRHAKGNGTAWDHFQVKGEVDASGCIVQGTRSDTVELKYLDAQEAAFRPGMRTRRSSACSAKFKLLLDGEADDWTNMNHN